MADKTTSVNNFEVYTITSATGKTRATLVPAKGGVVSSLVMPWNGGEREILYQHNYFWQPKDIDLPGGLPFLFPICARIERDGIFGNYLYDGELYNLPIHGFAPYAKWAVSDASRSDTITLTLTENATTLKMYPFRFRIDLEYSVSEGELLCRQKYINTGDRALPFYAGFHPYFLTPPPGKGKEAVLLNYKPKRRFRYNAKLTDLVGTQDLFSLPASVADPKVNEQLVELDVDKIITLTYPDQFQLCLQATGIEDMNLFRYVQLYTQEAAPFVCVEPWMGFPNALNSIFGVHWLAPGMEEHGILRMWVQNYK